ncbi:ABC transporter ATP-binding protein [Ilumatobacter nonamiensis]|uniref:ABC transporter ATP-binding protein n=1 Tax=Ilumatobacter nonamiensis TaxID=467093 RepID=UPI00034D254B|nr:ABC transporter ATP-binding protein [Ilumatobacter nonamiensis]
MISEPAQEPDEPSDDINVSRTSLLDVDGLSVEFLSGGRWTRVIEDVSLTIGRGETVGLVGESGSGKSVTSLAIMGLLPSGGSRTTGSICFDGINLVDLPEHGRNDLRGDRMSMVFQEPMTSLNPLFTIGDQIQTVIRRHTGCGRATAKRRAIEALDLMRIPAASARLRDYPHQFSGGMRQRVLMALALACRPELLIADEPTTALDVTVQAQLLDVLREASRELAMSVLFVTHDLAVVADVCDRVTVMYGGQVIENAGVHEMFDRPLHPYTDSLLRSVPAVDDAAERHVLAGNVPSPGSNPSGCRFAPRCAFADDECRAGPPELTVQEAGRSVRCRRAACLNFRRP